MQTSNFSSLVNSEWWGRNRDNRCPTANTLDLGDGGGANLTGSYWRIDLNRVEVNQITLTKTATDLENGVHAICFSKTGKYHSGENGLDGEIYLTLCKKTGEVLKCSIKATSPFS